MQTCAYCGAERPDNEMKQAKLIFRNSRYDHRGKRVQFVDEKLNWYCKDKTCAANDQMAHEG